MFTKKVLCNKNNNKFAINMMIIIIRFVSIYLFFVYLLVVSLSVTEHIIRMFLNLQINLKYIPLHNAFKT